MKQQIMILFFTLNFFWIPEPVYASDQVGTLTQVQGRVQLFTHPTKTLSAQSAQTAGKNQEQALFENEYYWVRLFLIMVINTMLVQVLLIGFFGKLMRRKANLKSI